MYPKCELRDQIKGLIRRLVEKDPEDKNIRILVMDLADEIEMDMWAEIEKRVREGGRLVCVK